MSNTIDLSGSDLVITSDTIYIGNSGSSYAYFSGDASTNLTIPGSLTLNSGEIYGSSTSGGVSVNINQNDDFSVTDTVGSFQFNPTTGNIYLTGGSSSSDTIAITAFEDNFVLSSNNNIQMKTVSDTTWLIFYPKSANIWGHNNANNASLYLSCDISLNPFVGINNYNNLTNYLKIIPNSSANTSEINNLVELDAAGSDLALTCQSNGNIYFGNDTQNTSNFPMYLNTSNSYLYMTGNLISTSPYGFNIQTNNGSLYLTVPNQQNCAISDSNSNIIYINPTNQVITTSSNNLTLSLSNLYLSSSNLYISGSVYGSSSDTGSFQLFNFDNNNGIQFNPGTGNTNEVIMFANCDNSVLLSSNNIQMKTGSLTSSSSSYFVFYPSSGTMTVSGADILQIDNDVYAYSYNQLSDYRIKSNIEKISSTYIDKLRPVTYTNNKNNKKEFGLIAHELQEHYPELVTGEKDSEKMQSINYIGLIPLLITEIQRLNSLTEKLTNEVEQLKKML
jgi:hypothetical protein